jgi:predicted nucleic acid-binding protein
VSFGEAPWAVIVDASAAVTFLQGDEDWVERWTSWAESDALVLAPAHFMAEVGNALLRSVRLPAADVIVQLHRLSRAGVETIDRGVPGLLEAVNLADEHRLTVYDALYLQLALDTSAELATLDADLAKAAQAEGVLATA